MTTNSIATAGAIGNAGTAGSLSLENRDKLANLAAEFESMLLNHMLRDMNESGKWSKLGESGLDTLGAEAYDQTFQVELSRYLSNAGGLGLSQQLLKALDSLAGTAETSEPRALAPFTAPGSPEPVVSPRAVSAPAAGNAARVGWNGLNLEAPAYGGSGAQWAGFNNDRAMGGGDDASVKDAFFRWTYGLAFNPAGQSKAGVEQYLKSNLDSAREYGLNILDVQGEHILVETEENGPEWIDVVVNAGSTNPGEVKWQWLPLEDGQSAGGGPLSAALAELRGLPQGSERARAVLADGQLSGTALLNALKAETSAALAGAPGPAQQYGAASLPAAGANLTLPAGAVTSAYGWRQDPFTGEAKFHKGVDVRAAEGTDVPSAGSGRVIFSGTDGGYGTSVIVQHANGLSTRYAHLSEALVKAGDEVADRQVIGRAGQTGRATAAHLHFEVMDDGVPVNPLRMP